MVGDPIPIDVWADVSCPWCYIGHRRLREALAGEPAGSVRVRPRAFELLPDLPPEGMPVDEFYPRRYGSAEAMADELGRATEEAARAGLALRYDRIRRAPNTRLAHRLVKLAGRRGRAPSAMAALFAAHFEHGVDLADPDAAVAAVTGAVASLDGGELRRELEAGEGEREVAAEEALASRLGITGVPFFLAGRAVAVSGAQDVDMLRRLVAAGRQALEAAA